MFVSSGLQSGYCYGILSQFDPAYLDAYALGAGVMERYFLLSYCVACCWALAAARSPLREVRQWTEMDFRFPSEADMRRALQQRYYVSGNSVPIDVDVQHRQGSQHSRIFVTIPRFDEGRPVTLGVVDERGLVSAYPDYSWHDRQGDNCDGLTSVFRVAIDECNRLWVMDAGKIGDEQRCPPQLLAFDLDSDRLLLRHRVNASEYGENSLFVTPVVDVRRRGSSCADTFVYVADVSGFGLLVVDVARGRSWRVNHRLFFPFPSQGSFTIDGESFDLMDGILGMALSPYQPHQERYLYFHSLAATTENVVRTSEIRNASYAQDPDADPKAMSVFQEERPSQAAAEAMDRDGIMYFGSMEPPAIWCWNSATEFSVKNFHQIARDQETLQFASGVKVVNNLKGEQELWVLTSSFQRVMTGTLSANRVNFRIHAEKIHRLLKNSPCARTPKDRSHGYHANIISPTTGYARGSSRYGVVSFL